VVIFFKHTGNAPELKQKKFKLAAHELCKLEVSIFDKFASKATTSELRFLRIARSLTLSQDAGMS
jgi:hypothetical protein